MYKITREPVALGSLNHKFCDNQNDKSVLLTDRKFIHYSEENRENVSINQKYKTERVLVKLTVESPNFGKSKSKGANIRICRKRNFFSE